MTKKKYINLQVMVFSLVWAAFTTIYITQPVLPVLQVEFGVNESMASLSISAVVLGIALANLPFGILADRFPIRPIILTGGLVISACGLFCAITTNLSSLVFARFVQGLFIPSLTTCLAAYLARSLPLDRLNVVMGSYVSATVAGGLSGRLLGGWIHPPLHWRYAFLSASVFLLIITIAAAHRLKYDKRSIEPDTAESMGFMALLSRADLLRTYFVAFGAFFVFSSIFNYLPFYLTGPPFNASTNVITMLYLSYVVGIVVSPAAGELSNRIGNGSSMVLGSLIFSLAIMATLVKSLVVVAISLTAVCAGFFTIHSAAAGSLNRKLKSNRGRANSLYILFYYIGGYAGITASGFAYGYRGWTGVAVLGIIILLLPLTSGIIEMCHTSQDHPR
jgi:YNFM family putative membrane transporter